MGYVYKIKNIINGKCYIGMTERNGVFGHRSRYGSRKNSLSNLFEKTRVGEVSKKK